MASAAPASGAAVPRDEPEIVAKSYPLLVLGVMMSMMIQLLDTTITIVAVPHMQTSLSASADTITWVLTSYIITTAVAMPATGWLSGRIGQRQLFLFSVGGFVVASMLCGMAQNLEQMVIFRGLQGIAGAFIAPLSQSSIIDATRPSRRAQIMALWGLGVVMGPILGPILGGLLTEHLNWRWVFFVNLPLGLISFALLWTQMPHREKRDRPFDFTGFVLIGMALCSLQLMLDRGPRLDWFDAGEIWIYLGITLGSAWAAVIHLATADHPLFDRDLFKDLNLLTAMMFIFVAGLILFTSMALLPPLLENILGYGVIETGFLLAVRGIGVMASMQLASLLVRLGFDSRLMVGLGFLVTGYSLYLMAGWSFDISPVDIALPGLLQGLGIGLVFIPLNIAAFATLPPHLRTDASSLMNLCRSIGSSLGVSALTALLVHNMQAAHEELGANITTGSTGIFDISSLDRFQQFGGAILAFADGMVNRQAAMIAYLNDFWAMMWLIFLTAPFTLLMRRQHRQ